MPEISTIPAVQMVLLRDNSRYERVFRSWTSSAVSTVTARAIERFPVSQFVTLVEAQSLIRPFITELLGVIRYICQHHSLTWWLELLRGSFGTLTGAFLDGQVGDNRLTKGDRFNVFRAMHIACVEYARDDTSDTIFAEQVPNLLSPSDDIDALPSIPLDYIRILKELFDAVTACIRAEKLYRVTGRGGRVIRQHSASRELFLDSSAVSGALAFYDSRIAVEYQNYRTAGSTGFPNLTPVLTNDISNLIAMAPVPASARDVCREFYESRFPEQELLGCLARFIPMPVSLSDLFAVLEAMPNATFRNTRLVPDQVRACLIALSAVVGNLFNNDSNHRTGLACYGCTAIDRRLFESELARHARLFLPHLTNDNVLLVARNFVQSVGGRRIAQGNLFDDSSVHRYMDSCIAFPSVDNKVIIDGLYLHHDLTGWLARFRVSEDPDDVDSRGTAFEKSVEKQLRQLDRGSTPQIILRGLEVRTSTKRPLTDIDILVVAEEILYLIDCKNISFSDRLFRGESIDVERRWHLMKGYLADWDKKMYELFSDSNWARLNRELGRVATGCSHVLPLILTPRPEWIPTLEPSLFVYGKNSTRLPRILVVAEVAELLRMRGLASSTTSGMLRIR